MGTGFALCGYAPKSKQGAQQWFAGLRASTTPDQSTKACRLTAAGFKTALLLAIMACAATPLAAQDKFLALPIDCDLGRTCFIEDYVDADPGSGQRDYTCGLKSRDDHRGTDFALLSFDAMAAGVDVLAAADGVVEAIRDGVDDRPYSAAIADQLRGRECGNAVRLRHENGYQTLYCHLENGSVAVQRGQRVAQGDPLGMVGLSGQTNYPHVHVTVLWDGEHIDPFNADATDTCGAASGSLWIDTPDYTPTGFFTAGFANHVPSFGDVQSGAARVKTLGPQEPMVVYGHIFHAQSGDTLHFSAEGPGGEAFKNSALIKDPQVQMFRAFGKRAPQAGWAKGAYRGYIRLMRADRVVAIRHADVVVE